MSRAIGPALAGVIVAAAGPSAAFMLNAVSFLGVVVVLARWRRETAPSTLPAERFFSAMRAGMRYVREAHALQAVMVRAVSFFLFATALLAIVATRRFSLEVPDALGAAGAHWPEPTAHDDLDLEPDRGPVMVTVEYRVDPSRAQAFGAAMQELASVRRRDGASSWGLFKDTADPERYIEFFLVESWVEHLRQHHRITQHDTGAASLSIVLQAAALGLAGHQMGGFDADVHDCGRLPGRARCA